MQRGSIRCIRSTHIDTPRSMTWKSAQLLGSFPQPPVSRVADHVGPWFEPRLCLLLWFGLFRCRFGLFRCHFRRWCYGCRDCPWQLASFMILPTGGLSVEREVKCRKKMWNDHNKNWNSSNHRPGIVKGLWLSALSGHGYLWISSATWKTKGSHHQNAFVVNHFPCWTVTSTQNWGEQL